MFAFKQVCFTTVCPRFYLLVSLKLIAFSHGVSAGEDISIYLQIDRFD